MAEAARRMRGHGHPPPPPPAAAERLVHAAPRHAAGSPATGRGQFRAVRGQVFIQLLYLHRHTHVINLGGGGHLTGAFARWHLWLRLPLSSLKPPAFPPPPPSAPPPPTPPRRRGEKEIRIKITSLPAPSLAPSTTCLCALLPHGLPQLQGAPPLQQRGAPRPLRSPEAEGEEWAGAPGPGLRVGGGADHLPPPPCWPRAPRAQGGGVPARAEAGPSLLPPTRSGQLRREAGAAAGMGATRSR